MRFVGLLVIVMGCCSWCAPPAWAGHTVTPPGLPSGWADSSARSDTENDPSSPVYKLGVGMANALNKGDAQAAANFVNTRALGKRVARSMYTDAEQQRAIENGYNNRSMQQVFEGYCTTLRRNQGSAKFMRVVMHAGEPRALVRLDAGSEGLEYLEFLVDRDDSGEYRVIDWYQLTRGRLASDSLGAMVRLMSDPDQSLLHRLFATTSFSADTVEKLRQVGALEHQGKYAESLALMNQLPPELADSVEVLRLRVADASRSKNDAEYYRTLGILARKYGDDLSVAMLLVDYYLKEKRFDKVQVGLTMIENRVGSDGLTNTLRSNFYQQTGEYDQAVAYARKAVQLEPDLRRAWVALASGYVLQKNYPQAVATYRTLQTRFGLNLTRKQFEGNPAFGPFLQSEAFKKWLPR